MKLSLGLSLALLVACSKAPPPAAESDEHKSHDGKETKEGKEGKEGDGGEADKEAAKREGDGGAEHSEHAEANGAFSVPFVDQEDPLEQTRNFFKDALTDNAGYRRDHKPEFFAAFATSQKPRVTLVTCSDSRVQAGAFDDTPENDLFTVRNIGDQVRLNQGSVEYGVRVLKTPVLLVLGHAGCGAVKVAMGETTKESEAIRHELEGLDVPKRKEGANPDDPGPWLDAVVDNVHDQVAFALTTFSEEIRNGRLTVVGAIYDFRNDYKRGAGTLSIIDVNGITDPKKMVAFEHLVMGLPVDAKPDAGSSAPAPVAANDVSPEAKSLLELRDQLHKITAKSGAEIKAP